MKLYYDFHIHTCLSPCGDNDMTPNNIVNMASLKGLDAIAITDHNCAFNASACIEAAKDLPLTVIPGMEIETSEEVHMVALFEDINNLYKMQDMVLDCLPKIKNKPEIFGEQIIMDSQDDVKGFYDAFLITACSMSVYEATKEVRNLNGVIFPAHIDKSSYSIVSNLGTVPKDLDFKTVEIKGNPTPCKFVEEGYESEFFVIHNSDAHYLWDISEKKNYIECKSNDISEILNKISLGR